eukprot:595479-Amphidinium_carterae.1
MVGFAKWCKSQGAAEPGLQRSSEVEVEMADLCGMLWTGARSSFFDVALAVFMQWIGRKIARNPMWCGSNLNIRTCFRQVPVPATYSRRTHIFAETPSSPQWTGKRIERGSIHIESVFNVA